MALTWTLALLSAYPPRARQQVEDEADAALTDGPADPARLSWTTAVVSEAMRLYRVVARHQMPAGRRRHAGTAWRCGPAAWAP